MTTNNNNINHVVAELEPYFERILPTGSRVICSPPPENTDEDYIILIKKDKLKNFLDTLEERDWYIGGSMAHNWSRRLELSEEHSFNQDGSCKNDNLFLSYKRREDIGILNEDTDPDDENAEEYIVEPSGPILNLLVTCNNEYFEDFVRATSLAKSLNLTSKADRVILFEALTRDKWPDPNKKVEEKEKKKPFWYNSFSTLYSSPGSVNSVSSVLQAVPFTTS